MTQTIAFALLILVLGVGCSKKESEDPGNEADPKSAPAASSTSTLAPAAEAQSRCRDRGEVGSCTKAVARAGGSKREEVIGEMREIACLHGDGEACAKRAEKTRTPALWFGMACRRGAASACASADPWAKSVGERATVTTSSDGPAGARLRAVHSARIVDCFAQLPKKLREGAADVTVALTVAEHGASAIEVDAVPAALASCIERAARRWRFGDSAAGPASIALKIRSVTPDE